MDQKSEEQTAPLQFQTEEQKLPFSDKQPPPLSQRMRRPWRGIFLSYFLLFCGLLFFTHGFHKYAAYTVWDLIAVWTLSSLLMIPGTYFGLIILCIQLRVRGFTYKNYPQLIH